MRATRRHRLSPTRPIRGLLKQTWQSWNALHGPLLGAALAYYTLLSLAPLLALLLSAAGALVGEETVRLQLAREFRALLGDRGAEPISQFLLAFRPYGTTPFTAAVTFGVLLWGAALVFSHLQKSLNLVWGISTERHPVHRFVLVRSASLLLICAIVIVVVAVHLFSTLLSAVERWAPTLLPAPSLLLHAGDFVASFVALLVVIALIYKVLPDAHVPWADAWIGAMWTALLLVSGKAVVAAYLSRISLVSIYGAAVSGIVVLLGVFFYAQILLFGAVLTQVRAARRAESKRERAARTGREAAARPAGTIS